MYQIFESLKIALAAIWANRLRSFLTVLGNIVAVTSIIAVVSIVQGIDDYVTNAIQTDLGRRHVLGAAVRNDHQRGGVREGRRATRTSRRRTPPRSAEPAW